MECTFYSFDIGRGDCLFLLLSQKTETYSIMIDCPNEAEGCCDKLEDVENFVSIELKNKIDLLIVTHIDNDHISGLRKLLKKHKTKARWEIGCIWYNYDGCRDPIELDDSNKRAPGQAISLAKLLRSDKKWLEVWERNTITTNSNVLPANWKSCFGNLIILSPSQDRINDLAKVYKDWRKKHHNLRDTGNGKDLELSLIDCLAESEDEPNESLSMLEGLEWLFNEAENKHVIDKSVANGASIAIAWESTDKNHSILLSGDAWHSEIIEGLKHYGVTNESGPKIFDLIKVSHHGSSANTNNEILKLVDSPIYVISGFTDNTINCCPAGARIVLRSIPENSKFLNRQIVFSHPSPVAQKLEAMGNDILTEKKFSVFLENKIKLF